MREGGWEEAGGRDGGGGREDAGREGGKDGLPRLRSAGEQTEMSG